MRPHLYENAATVLVAALGLACPGAQARRLLSKTGNVTLFSDASCADPAYVNSFILGADVCGRDNAATPYLDPFASFVVNERPWCENGSRPYFNLYSDDECADLVASLPPGGTMYGYADGEEDGACVAPGAYRGMAFLCDGLAGVDSGGRGEGEGEDEDDEEGDEDAGIVTVSATSTSIAGGHETTQSAPTSTSESLATGSASSTETTASLTTAVTSSSSSSILSSTSATAIFTGGASATTTIEPRALLIFAFTITIVIIV